MIRGTLYTLLIDPLVGSIRKRMTQWITESGEGPVLDVCCGPGTQCRQLASRGLPVAGLDLDGRLIRYAASAGGGIAYVEGDARRMPWRDGAFPRAILSFALHDKEADGIRTILNEAERILNENGRLYVADFACPSSLRSRIGNVWTCIPELAAGRRHYRNGRRFIRRGGATARLEGAGWTVLRRFDYPWGNTVLLELLPPDRPGT